MPKIVNFVHNYKITMGINIFTLTSRLHDAEAITRSTSAFLSSLGFDYSFKGEDFADYGKGGLDLIYVRTGGTEGLFLEMLGTLETMPRKFHLLTSGESNSLAASMEILSYLNNNGMTGEIIHGDTAYINQRISIIEKTVSARAALSGMTLGVIGKPSDWLISSGVDYDIVKKRLGVTLVDISMEELLEVYGNTETPADDMINEARNDEEKLRISNAVKLYEALKVIIERYHLSGFTIRCFDLLTAIRNTGCLSLARFNAQGIVATCEGDIPAMLSMAIAQVLTGYSGFQCNASTINPVTGEILFAHCTIPFNMVTRYELDTHFESGLGVGIRGYSQPGPVTVFKTAGDMSRHFAEEGELKRCQGEPNLCRTQQIIALDNVQATQYFLTRPIGNHHVVIPGRCKALLDEILD